MEISMEEYKLIPTICLTGNPNSYIVISIKSENEDSQIQRLTTPQPQLLLLPQYNNHEKHQQEELEQQLMLMHQPIPQPNLASPQQQQQLQPQPSVLAMQNNQQTKATEKKAKEKPVQKRRQSLERKSKEIQQKRPKQKEPTKPRQAARNTENKKPRVPKASRNSKPPIPKSAKHAFVVILPGAKLPEDWLDPQQESPNGEAARKTVITPREFASTSQESETTEPKAEPDLKTETKEEIPANIDSDEELQDIFVRLANHSYQCNICQLVKHDRRGILSHIYGKHSHLRPYKCNICGKNFKRKYTMKQHELWHTTKNNEPVKCEKCDYKTPNKVSLRYHYYRVHTTDYRFTCEDCGKMFKFKRELIDHMVIHSNLQYICDICGKIYRGEHLLKAHRRLHLDIYKFQCTICKKKLASEDSLDKHLKLHSRTFECNECGMKFPTKHNLIKHRNVHTREQAYTCPICGKVFADHPTQKVHSLTHAGLKPYRCNVCGAGFTQRTPMMLHWRKKHPEETEAPPPVLLKNILQSIEAQNARKEQQSSEQQSKQ